MLVSNIVQLLRTNLLKPHKIFEKNVASQVDCIPIRSALRKANPEVKFCKILETANTNRTKGMIQK